MPTIFTKIINGEIPCCKVAENSDFLAFFDINPVVKGHTLVIPKKEVDYLFNMEDDLYQRLLLFSKKVALAIEKCVPCKRIGVAVVGLEVPHAHLHLIPINEVGDLSFSRPRIKMTQAEFSDLASKIASVVVGA